VGCGLEWIRPQEREKFQLVTVWLGVASQGQEATTSNSPESGETVSEALVEARRLLHELPDVTLAETIELYVAAAGLGNGALMARALTVQGQIALHLGDVHGALELSVEAERMLEDIDDLVATAESCCLRSRVSFFTGALAEALKQAHEAIRYANQSEEEHLRLFALRNASFVFGNAELHENNLQVLDMIDLAVATGHPWEEAAGRNDWALLQAEAGQLDAAIAEIERAARAAERVEPSLWLRAGIAGSRAQIELMAGRARNAIESADASRALFDKCSTISPHMLSGTVNVQVKARTELGDFEAASDIAETALADIGDSSSNVNGEIFAALAEALRAAGRVEEAYDALSRSAELQRAAFRELEQMRLKFERASLEASMLRNQLERDWLTGLYNRRFLAREMSEDRGGRFEFPLCVAVLDLDNFKEINDTFGHPVGDQVLVRLANLMRHAVRPVDVVARSGGEEFTLVLPNTRLSAGAAVSERLRIAVESQSWDDIAIGLTVTSSIGVTGARSQADFDRMVSIADANLYAAKRAGRNRVVTGSPPDLDDGA
jgi:diguanylate cyclase (GGDEF)-like protein